jgi:DNA (cytosine-5)-methyltransferase 1
VFENVRGLTVGRHRALLEEIVEAFHACGYEVRLPWRVLNSSRCPTWHAAAYVS